MLWDSLNFVDCQCVSSQLSKFGCQGGPAHATLTYDVCLLHQAEFELSSTYSCFLMARLQVAGIVSLALAYAYGGDIPSALPYLPGVQDHGIIFRFGSAPHKADYLGARDTWLWYDDADPDTPFHMTYDGSGPQGWLACLAVSSDPTLQNWTLLGSVLELGSPGTVDSKSASYLTTFKASQGDRWGARSLSFGRLDDFHSPLPSCISSSARSRGQATTSRLIRHHRRLVLCLWARTTLCLRLRLRLVGPGPKTVPKDLSLL